MRHLLPSSVIDLNFARILCLLAFCWLAPTQPIAPATNQQRTSSTPSSILLHNTQGNRPSQRPLHQLQFCGMERFSRLFTSFLALSLTIIRASSLVSNGFAPPTRTHLPITTRIKQHPQLRLIQRSNEDVYDRTKRQGSWRCYSTNEANDNRDSEDYAKQNIQTVEVTADSLTPSQIKSLSPDSQTSSFWGTLKSFFSNKKNKLSRESLGKLGMSALLAYGFVSNVSGVIAVSSAWFIFCTRVSRYHGCYLLCTCRLL